MALIDLRVSKSDQEGAGRKVGLPYGPKPKHGVPCGYCDSGFAAHIKQGWSSAASTVPGIPRGAAS